jgi:hypothetical protein
MTLWSIGPKVPSLRRLLGTGFLCAVLAGIYGALHDQISFTISPEYFTCIKFQQFEWIGLGSHPRLFAAAIGFMATWWVGFVGGWLLVRLGPSEPSTESNSDLIKALTVVLVVTVAGGLVYRSRRLEGVDGGFGSAPIPAPYHHHIPALGKLYRRCAWIRGRVDLVPKVFHE